MNSDVMNDGACYTERPGLELINCADLMDERFDKIDWIVDGLLKPGLSVLAGAPKIGKSWMVLQLCLCIAKGEPFWGMETHRGSVLYITLEDSKMRIQDRILRITEEYPEKLDISLKCPGLGEQLCDELANYAVSHSDARLVVIDTFQKIREQAGQMSYAGDYSDVSYLKHIADQLGLCILLVHHTRKLGDSDYINEISGTNGIAGSADTLFILKKEKRCERKAVLSCTGRDIEDRELELYLDNETCVWNKVSDTYNAEPKVIPPLLLKLIVYAGKIGYYDGNNTEFCERFADDCGENITPNRLKRMMNLFRYELEDAGVFFLSVKRNGQRRLAVYYKKREDGLRLSPDDAEKETSLRDDPDDEREEIPLPTDDDAPPLRTPDREYDGEYKPYR